ncbi:mucin-2-like [Hypanus sabinus]|uniref:mucin-2-like n=1 Tax=Hypanus sabinus TaxID=79690 RepID=UPI0028C4AF12|nr:mucin-2-like [Hypanus sabinus]
MRYYIYIITFVLFLLKDLDGSGVTQTLRFTRDTSSASVQEPRTCSTWGQGAFKTFTDDFYYFTSNCSYILSRQCKGDKEDFNVEILRDAHGNLEHIFMKIEDSSIVVANGEIKVKNNIVSLPYNDKLIDIQQYGTEVRFSNKKHTVSVIWNYNDALSITVDVQYQGKLCGLCGPFDESVLSTYDYQHTLQANLDTQNSCTTVFPEETTCESTKVCSEIPKHFKSCSSEVINNRLMKMCQMSVCACRGAPRCHCASFERAARQCIHVNPPMWNTWRDTYNCTRPSCPGNQVFQECGPACMPTCTDPNSQQQCDQCINTCGCKAGLVLDNLRGGNRCISQEDCPCEYNGEIYSAGKERNSLCQSCTCEGGMWDCIDLNCPGTCKIEEGTHITTFDGTYYNLIGDCSYYAVVTKDWSVKIEMHPCNAAYKQTCLQRVTYTIHQNIYTINNDGTVQHNGNTMELPLGNGNIMIFEQSSHYIQMHAKSGLKMQIQISPIMQLYISLPKSAQGSTKGLCGTFNDNAEDDFLSAQNIVEHTFIPFSDSWKDNEKCPLPKLNPVCVSSENENFAKEHCAYLKDPTGAFSRCHAMVEFDRYYEMCKAASCHCKKVSDCVCAALGAYAHACASKGITVKNWRRSVCRVSCPTTQIYHHNVRACNRTCQFLSSPDFTCELQDVPVDGCGCAEGLYMNDKKECVNRAQCPCYVNGMIIPQNEIISLNGMECFCLNGVPSCPNRNKTLILKDCKKQNKVFSDCEIAGECKRTCETLNKPCSKPCVPGCVCPKGLVEDSSGRCIAPFQCPCLFGGEKFLPGETIKSDCNTCKCKGGIWNCTNDPCPKTCHVYGDGHYITFDGKRYSFDGNCEYIFVEDQCLQDSGTFQILTESVSCCAKGVTCSRNIRILFEEKEIILLSESGVSEVSLRDNQCTDKSYSVHTVGLYLVLTFSNGITVIWDKRTRFSVTLDPRWKNKVCGLCGNFNDELEDDLSTKGNSLMTNFVEFGNSWKSMRSCANALSRTFPCENNPYCLAWAQKRCSIITGPIFQACHKIVDPTPYYEACVQEACACDMEGKYLGLCTAIAVYAEACNKANVCIHWRTPDLCPVFCEYYNTPDGCIWHYQPCGTVTTKTCLSHFIGKKYSAVLEGCYAKCPDNAPYLDENTMKCVTLPRCTCYYEGRILQPGEITMNDCEECVCHNGITTCRQVTTAATTTTESTTSSTTEETTTTPTTTKSTTTSTTVETTTPTTTTTTESTTTSTTGETTTTTTPSTTTSTIVETTTPTITTTTESTTTSTTVETTTPTTTTTTESTTTSTTVETTTPTTTTTTESTTTSTTETTTPTTTTTTESTTTSTTEETTTTTTPSTTTSTIVETTTPTTTTTTESTTTSTTVETTTPTTTTTTESTTTSTTVETTTPTITTTTESTTTSTTVETTTPTTTTTTESTTTSTTVETTTPTTTTTTESTTTSTTVETTTPTTTTTTESTTTSTTEETTTTTTPKTTTPTITTTTESTTTSTTETTTPTTTTTTESTTTSTTVETTTPTTTTTTESTTTSTTVETTTPTITTTTESTTTSTTVETTTPTTTTTTESTTTSTTVETTTPTTTTTTESTTTSTTGETTTTMTPSTTTSTIVETTTPTTTTTTESTTTSATVETTTPTTTTTPESTTTSTTEKTSTPTTTIETTTEPYCPGEWSPWINKNTPSPLNPNDYESLKPGGKPLCQPSYKITNIQCQFANKSDWPLSLSSNVVTCNTDIGLMCSVSDKTVGDLCNDYRIRVCCEPTEETTTVPTTTASEECFCDTNPRRKCNETWKENCATHTCVKDVMFKIEHVACEMPLKPKCYNGLRPVRVKTEDGCCSAWDCEYDCHVWGGRHYRTFDGIFYNFFENCAHILVQEIVPKYNFTVILDNYYCTSSMPKTCRRTLIIHYGGNVIHLLSGYQPSVLFNGIPVSFPYDAEGVNISRMGFNVRISLPYIRTTITGHKHNFRIQVPEQYFLDNTQGQCGYISKNKNDDCRRRDGKVEPPNCCHKTAFDWKIDDPNKPQCRTAPTNVPCTPPPPPPSCKRAAVCDVLKEEVFSTCSNNMYFDYYYKACQFDNCEMNGRKNCSSQEDGSCESGSRSAEDLDSGSKEQMGSGSKEQMGSGSKEKSGKGSKEKSGSGSKENSGKGSKEKSGSGSKEQMGSGSKEQMGSGSKEKSGKGSKEKSGSGSKENSGKGSKEKSGSGSKEQMGSGSKEKSGKGSKEKSGSGSSEDDCSSREGDKCKSNTPKIDCSSLEAAAEMCRRAGSCVDWRTSTNGLCDHVCPNGFIYKACSSHNHNYCKNNMMILGDKFDTPTEGCFCPDGMMLSEDETQCVPSCIRCEDFSGRLRNEGETWFHPNNTCVHFTCTKGVVVETKITCSSQSSCDEASKVWDEFHCCYQCPLEVQRCAVQPKRIKLTKDVCSAFVEVNSCEGFCRSFSIFNSMKNGMMHKCECCQENEVEEKETTLNCHDGKTMKYKYSSAKTCTCKLCKDKPVFAKL